MYVRRPVPFHNDNIDNIPKAALDNNSAEVHKLFYQFPNCIPERYKIAVSKNVFNLYLFHKKLEKITQKSIPPRKRELREFRIGKLLGSGKFGRVYLARDKVHNMEVAIKMMNKANIKFDKLEHQVEREIKIQSKLKHPNIIELYSYFCDQRRVYLVLEYASGGEIFDHLRNSPLKRFPNCLAAKYTYQVADALNYCHENQIIHRDIKPENLILTSDGNIKLSDFGWSVNSLTKRKTLCGTLDYIAPEMILKKYYDKYVDNWCLGVLCYEFLVGKPPFQSVEGKETFHKIISVNYTFPDFMCQQAADLISRLLRKNPHDRLSLHNVMKHEWIVFRMNAYKQYMNNCNCITSY